MTIIGLKKKWRFTNPLQQNFKKNERQKNYKSWSNPDCNSNLISDSYTMSKPKILVGLDPDIIKNGVAINNCGNIELCNLKFFELFDKLKELKALDIPLLVIVEGGWLNKSNWHKKKNGTSALNAEIGKRTGENHGTGKKIVEMLEYLNISHITVKPTKSKLNAKVFKNLTKIQGRTNQETRDAYMLIFGI